MSLLLIGVGNPLRGDDGVGPVAAQRLHELWSTAGVPHRLVIVQQLTPELAEDVAEPSVTAVLFVDAAVDSGDVGEPEVCRLVSNEVKTAGHRTSDDGASSHHMTPETLVAVAGELFQARPACWVLRIPAWSFEFGAPFSDRTQRALEAISEQANALCLQMGLPTAIT